MKDLFSGSLGKLNSHGGSRMYTTPNTVYVPPDYEIETDVPSVAKFVTCSLDGRLWVFKRSRRYYVAVFRWNEDTQRFEFVSTTILNNETVVKCGVDWILTNKSFIQPSDDEPYISRTEYSSDDTSYINKINYHYSFYPELYKWQLITWGNQFAYNGRITLLASNGSKIYIRYSDIKTIEFFYSSEDGQFCICNSSEALTNIHLYYINEQIYAKGKIYIGRAYLYNSNNGFYLLISPDYCRNYREITDANGIEIEVDETDGWDKLFLAPLNSEHVAIFILEQDNLSLCKKAENARVFDINEGNWVDYSENNGHLLFDVHTGHNLLFNDKYVSLLREDIKYEGKGIKQWLIPSTKIESISPQFIVSQIDNASLVCFLQEGMYRVLFNGEAAQLVSEKQSVLTCRDISNKKHIDVYNSNLSIISNEPIFRNVSRKFFNVMPKNCVEKSYLRYESSELKPFFCSSHDKLYHNHTNELGDFYTDYKWWDHFSDADLYGHLVKEDMKIFYILPEDGSAVEKTFSVSCSHSVKIWVEEGTNKMCINAQSVALFFSQKSFYQQISYYTKNSNHTNSIMGSPEDFVPDYSQNTKIFGYDDFENSIGRWKRLRSIDNQYDNSTMCLRLEEINRNIATFEIVKTGVYGIIETGIKFNNIDISNILSSYGIEGLITSFNVDNYYSTTGGFINLKGVYFPTEFRHILVTGNYFITLKTEYTPEIISLLQEIDGRNNFHELDLSQ